MDTVIESNDEFVTVLETVTDFQNSNDRDTVFESTHQILIKDDVLVEIPIEDPKVNLTTPSISQDNSVDGATLNKSVKKSERKSQRKSQNKLKRNSVYKTHQEKSETLDNITETTINKSPRKSKLQESEIKTSEKNLKSLSNQKQKSKNLTNVAEKSNRKSLRKSQKALNAMEKNTDLTIMEPSDEKLINADLRVMQSAQISTKSTAMKTPIKSKVVTPVLGPTEKESQQIKSKILPVKINSSESESSSSDDSNSNSSKESSDSSTYSDSSTSNESNSDSDTTSDSSDADTVKSMSIHKSLHKSEKLKSKILISQDDQLELNLIEKSEQALSVTIPKNSPVKTKNESLRKSLGKSQKLRSKILSAIIEPSKTSESTSTVESTSESSIESSDVSDSSGSTESISSSDTTDSESLESSDTDTSKCKSQRKSVRNLQKLKSMSISSKKSVLMVQDPEPNVSVIGNSELSERKSIQKSKSPEKIKSFRMSLRKSQIHKSKIAILGNNEKKKSFRKSMRKSQKIKSKIDIANVDENSKNASIKTSDSEESNDSTSSIDSDSDSDTLESSDSSESDETTTSSNDSDSKTLLVKRNSLRKSELHKKSELTKSKIVDTDSSSSEDEETTSSENSDSETSDSSSQSNTSKRKSYKSIRASQRKSQQKSIRKITSDSSDSCDSSETESSNSSTASTLPKTSNNSKHIPSDSDSTSSSESSSDSQWSTEGSSDSDDSSDDSDSSIENVVSNDSVPNIIKDMEANTLELLPKFPVTSKINEDVLERKEIGLKTDEIASMFEHKEKKSELQMISKSKSPVSDNSVTNKCESVELNDESNSGKLVLDTIPSKLKVEVQSLLETANLANSETVAFEKSELFEDITNLNSKIDKNGDSKKEPPKTTDSNQMIIAGESYAEQSPTILSHRKSYSSVNLEKSRKSNVFSIGSAATVISPNRNQQFNNDSIGTDPWHSDTHVNQKPRAIDSWNIETPNLINLKSDVLVKKKSKKRGTQFPLKDEMTDYVQRTVEENPSSMKKSFKSITASGDILEGLLDEYADANDHITEDPKPALEPTSRKSRRYTKKHDYGLPERKNPVSKPDQFQRHQLPVKKRFSQSHPAMKVQPLMKGPLFVKNRPKPGLRIRTKRDESPKRIKESGQNNEHVSLARNKHAANVGSENKHMNTQSRKRQTMRSRSIQSRGTLSRAKSRDTQKATQSRKRQTMRSRSTQSRSTLSRAKSHDSHKDTLSRFSSRSRSRGPPRTREYERRKTRKMSRFRTRIDPRRLTRHHHDDDVESKHYRGKESRKESESRTRIGKREEQRRSVSSGTKGDKFVERRRKASSSRTRSNMPDDSDDYRRKKDTHEDDDTIDRKEKPRTRKENISRNREETYREDRRRTRRVSRSRDKDNDYTHREVRRKSRTKLAHRDDERRHESHDSIRRDREKRRTRYKSSRSRSRDSVKRDREERRRTRKLSPNSAKREREERRRTRKLSPDSAKREKERRHKERRRTRKLSRSRSVKHDKNCLCTHKLSRSRSPDSIVSDRERRRSNGLNRSRSPESSKRDKQLSEKEHGSNSSDSVKRDKEQQYTRIKNRSISVEPNRNQRHRYRSRSRSPYSTKHDRVHRRRSTQKSSKSRSPDLRKIDKEQRRITRTQRKHEYAVNTERRHSRYRNSIKRDRALPKRSRSREVRHPRRSRSRTERYQSRSRTRSSEYKYQYRENSRKHEKYRDKSVEGTRIQNRGDRSNSINTTSGKSQISSGEERKKDVKEVVTGNVEEPESKRVEARERDKVLDVVNPLPPRGASRAVKKKPVV
ncbi:hypothetical protein HK096_007468 [Nowakowskiella sp. JEL0078]|nr:hypothetical protein HK096_007468 [Nowakowskiella sp. JEL0078]